LPATFDSAGRFPATVAESTCVRIAEHLAAEW